MKLTEDPVLRLRMRAQRLAGLATGDAADLASVVKEVCGVQAQEMLAAGLAVRARSSGLVAADVERARVEERTVVRTWGPRGTLHLLGVEDLGWMLPLLGPVFVAAGARRRAQLGLDDDTYEQALRITRDVLASRGPLIRAEIVDELAARGIRLEGQARPHFLGRAAL